MSSSTRPAKRKQSLRRCRSSLWNTFFSGSSFPVSSSLAFRRVSRESLVNCAAKSCALLAAGWPSVARSNTAPTSLMAPKSFTRELIGDPLAHVAQVPPLHASLQKRWPQARTTVYSPSFSKQTAHSHPSASAARRPPASIAAFICVNRATCSSFDAANISHLIVTCSFRLFIS